MKKSASGRSRRNFLGTATAVAAGTALGGNSLFGAPSILKYFGQPDSFIKGVRIGVITYSYRSMADQSIEAVLKYVTDSGIGAIELMGDPAEAYAGKPENPVDFRELFTLRRKQRDGALSAEEEKQLQELQVRSEAYNKDVAQWRMGTNMDKFEEIRKMYNDAGVGIYAFKPRAFGKDNTDAEIDWGFRAAKALGATHVTLEHPGDDAHTLKLGNMAARHKIYVGYHGHEQQTPTLWDTALGQSRYNALNLDLGHYVAAGNTAPLEIIKGKHDRIVSMHLKDRKTPDHGKENVLWGTGDTPIAEALHLMRSKNYGFPGTIELEYEIPEGSNAVEEVKRCLAYCEQALK
jgi:hypothetical protein